MQRHLDARGVDKGVRTWPLSVWASEPCRTGCFSFPLQKRQKRTEVSPWQPSEEWLDQLEEPSQVRQQLGFSVAVWSPQSSGLRTQSPSLLKSWCLLTGSLRVVPAGPASLRSESEVRKSLDKRLSAVSEQLELPDWTQMQLSSGRKGKVFLSTMH